MLDFRMETFLCVCECMNYTKASEILHITQPAVSQHIHYLEKYYGTKLFSMEGKKLRITKEGEALRSVALRMKNDEIRLKEHFLDMSKGFTELKFGATKTVGDFVIPDVLSRYLKDYPDTHVYMKVANTSELLKCLEEGELDFALVEGYFQKSEYDFLHYSTEKYICVCSPDYLWENDHRKIEDLLSERLLVRESGSGTREVLERYLELNNYTVESFRDKAEIGSMHAIKELCRRGCGITFLYETAVRDELESGALVKVELDGFDVYHDFTLIWRKDSVYDETYKTLFRRIFTVPG